MLLLGSAAHPALLARGGGLAQDSPPATTPATSQVDIRDLIGRLFGRNADTEPDIQVRMLNRNYLLKRSGPYPRTESPEEWKRKKA